MEKGESDRALHSGGSLNPNLSLNAQRERQKAKKGLLRLHFRAGLRLRPPAALLRCVALRCFALLCLATGYCWLLPP